MPLDVLSALQATAQGKYVPQPVTGGSGGASLPDWATGPNQPPPTYGGSIEVRPQAGDVQGNASAPFDVLSALKATAQGKYQPINYPPLPPPQPGILGRVGADLYGGLTDVVNTPGRLWNLGQDVLTGLGGDPSMAAKVPDVLNPNPMNVPDATSPVGRAFSAATRALPSVALLGPEGRVLQGAGEMSAAAAPTLTPATRAITALGRGMAEAPTGPTIFPITAGAATGQTLSDQVPDAWKPYADLLGNVAGGGIAALGQEAALRGASGLARTAGGLGIGPKVDIGGIRATGAQADRAASTLAGAIGPEGAARVAAEPVPLPADAGLRSDADLAKLPPGARPQVPGYAPTMAEIAQTPGAVSLEKTFRTAPDSAPAFMQRAEQQNAANLGVIDTLGGDGKPSTVGSLLQARLAAVDAAGQADVAAARDRNAAVSAFPAGKQDIPGGATAPEQYGADIRAQAMTARAAASARVDALRNAIDPDGNAGTFGAPFRQAVEAPYADLPRTATPPSTGEQAIRAAVQDWGAPGHPVVPVSEIFGLRERVNDELSTALNPNNPDRAAGRRLQLVKQGLDAALAQTVDQHAAFEAQMVAAGQMPSSATIEARLRNEAFSAGPGDPDAFGPTGGPGGAFSGGIPPGEAAGRPGVAGAQVPGQGGRGSSASNRSLADAAAALKGSNRKPESLADFLIQRGGVQDQTGDLAAVGADAIHHRAGGRLVNARGLTPDYAREAAAEAGFLRPNSDVGDLYDALAEEAAGRPVYRPEDAHEASMREAADAQAGRDEAWREDARSRVASVEHETGVTLSPTAAQHATDLVMDGHHPYDAVLSATRDEEETVLQREAERSGFGYPGVPAGAQQARMTLPGGKPAPGGPTQPLSAKSLEAFGKYLKAAAAKAQTFDNGAIGEVLKYGDHRTGANVPSSISRARGGFAKTDAEVLGMILRKGVTEAQAVRQAEDAGISPGLLKAALADELRARAVGPDGSFDRAKYAEFRRDHAGALHVYPEVRRAFDGAAAAEDTLSNRAAVAAKAREAFETATVKNFISEEPTEAMRRAFSQGDSERNVRELLSKLQGNPEALAGARRIAGDYIMKRLSSMVPAGGAQDFLNARQFRKWTADNAGAIKLLFGGQGLNYLGAVAAGMRRQAQRTVAVAGSDTAQKLAGLAKHGMGPEHGEGFGNVAAVMIGEHAGEILGAHPLVGMTVGAIAKPLVQRMRAKALQKGNDLVREGLLHPTTVGRELLDRVGADGQLTKRNVGRLSRVLAANAGAAVPQAVAPNR